MLRKYLLLLWLCCVAPAAVLTAAPAAAQTNGTTYYVDPAGNDAHHGRTPSRPWRTLARVNAAYLLPGDRVLLRAGRVFDGPLILQERCGTAEAPLVIGSYGDGRAVVRAENQTAVAIANCGGIELRDLVLQGRETGDTPGHGVYIENNLPQVELSHIYLRRLTVSGFYLGGVTISGVRLGAGFRDVQITDSVLHNNGDHGILVHSTGRIRAVRDVLIADNVVYDHPGIFNSGMMHTGSGILVGGAEQVLIERNEAYRNGRDSVWSDGGPIGIWAWWSDRVVIQHNHSHHNLTGSWDGGGFDLDGGVTNSVMQYNYSHDNMGAGYLVGQFVNAQPMANNVVRYNISRNDGRANGYGGIHLFNLGTSAMTDIAIYHNTVWMDAAPPGQAAPAALRIADANIAGVQIDNNLFLTGEGVTAVSVREGAGPVTIRGNNYHAFAGTLSWQHGAERFDTLDAWRQVTGYELWQGWPVGLTLDPLLTLTVGEPSAAMFQLSEDSPLIDAGLSLQAAGYTTGDWDYFGNPAPAGLGPDVGAHEAPDVHPTAVGVHILRTNGAPSAVLGLAAAAVCAAVLWLARRRA